MWRSVKACLPWETGSFPRHSEERFDKCTCTPFAFCSCNVNNVETINVGGLPFISKVVEADSADILSDPSGGAIVSFPRCLEYP